jgi:hypothetical protein
MAFTTAGTATVTKAGSQQFQGLFSDMWAISITGANPASVAAGAEDTQTYTVTGLALGDIVLFNSLSVSETVDADINAYVSAANTLTIRITNLHATVALDFAAGTTIKVLIGRPNW